MARCTKDFRLTLFATILALFLSAGNGAAQIITYHGGPIMPNPIHVYLIWYGQWSTANDDPPQYVLPQFLYDSAYSRYAHTNDEYGGATQGQVFYLAGTAVDQYSQGFGTLTERTIYNIVVGNAELNGWPMDDPAALFLVLGSANLPATLHVFGGVSVFNQTMCGWHASLKVFQGDNNPDFTFLPSEPNLRFGYVGDPGNGGACMQQFNPAIPNHPELTTSQVAPNDQRADAMINHVAHELMEAASDPDADAWHDMNSHSEGNDHCPFIFGTPPFPTGGPHNGNYNLQLGGNYYFVQEQWVNLNGGFCGMLSRLSEPTPVYPYDGLLHVGHDFTARWRSGLDGASPVDPKHPVTYTVWYKYWPYGSVESPYQPPLPAPCTIDASGICSTPETNEADGNYRWYVEANLDTSPPPHSSPALVTTRSSVATFTVGYQRIETIPPPLPPTPVYPYDGAQGVSSNFLVEWHDGLDAERRNSGRWPVTYAIYYEYWPFGGVEPQNYTLVVANQPCNPVALGICSTYVTGEPAGNFRWYVIANMDASLFTGVPNSILSTQSSAATFTVQP